MNITLSIDEDLVRKVRKIAIDRNTTLTQMVRDYLKEVSRRGDLEKHQALIELEATFDECSGLMGERRWTRNELHER
jgi:metal-responsive CopG/Arc/MetJ family transcriptional regulator